MPGTLLSEGEWYDMVVREAWRFYLFLTGTHWGISRCGKTVEFPQTPHCRLFMYWKMFIMAVSRNMFRVRCLKLMIRHLGAILTTTGLFLTLAVLQDGTAAARIYHVDVHRGNDTFPGTQSEPFSSIARVSEVLRAGDKAIIHPGIYHEQIMKGYSGSPGSPITYEGTDGARVVLDGSVRVTDWQRSGNTWFKKGLKPITPENAFVMVDEKRLLKRSVSLRRIDSGSFHLAEDGTYTIRLWQDANPNTDHAVDVYELDMAFNAGDRWDGNARRWVVLRNLTLQKYGGHAISTDLAHPADSDHWELDGLVVRLNYHEGVFACLDDWYVHGCSFMRNRGHGCQVNGARVRFERNESSENEWFGAYEHGGCGILVGPDASATGCTIRENVFRNNGDPNGYGCGVYLEGRSHGNRITHNVIAGGTHAGICFYGSSDNEVTDNVLQAVAPENSSPPAGAFVVGPSFEGEPNSALGNLVDRNTVRDCSAPVACVQRNRSPREGRYNRFADNLFVGCHNLLPPDPLCRIVMENNRIIPLPDREKETGDVHDNNDRSPGVETGKGAKGHGRE